jgi:hypothetical protein
MFLVGPVGLAALGIGGLVISHDPLYALAIVGSAFVHGAGGDVHPPVQQARRQVGRALELNEDAPHPLGDGSQEDT